MKPRRPFREHPTSYRLVDVITVYNIICTSFLLSVHFLNVVSMYPPAVCTHPLPSQRLLNRRQP